MTHQAGSINSVLAQQGSFQLSVGADSNKGHRRQNEDSLTYYSIGRAQIAVIADGMGGGLDGKLFSQLAIDSIRKYLTGKGPGTAHQQIEDALQKTANDLHSFRNTRPDYRGSGTTIVVAWIEAYNDAGRAIIANVGDSRAYLIKAQGNISQITRDHTYGERLIDEGFSEEQAYQDHQAARLTYALGEALDIKRVPECFSEVILEPGDRILLCTDGVYKPVPPEELAMLASKSPPQEAASLLLKRAIARGSRDNVSAILVHYLPPVQTAVAAPTGKPKWVWALAAAGLVGMFAAGAVVGGSFFGAANANSGEPTSVASITALPPTETQATRTATAIPAFQTSTPATALPTATPTATATETATSTPTPSITPSPIRVTTTQSQPNQITVLTTQTSQSVDTSETSDTTAPADQPIAPPADQPANPPADQPVAPPADQPANPPADQPVVPPADQPANPPADQPVAPPAEQPANPPAEQPANPPAEQPANPPAEQPANPPAASPENPAADSDSSTEPLPRLPQWPGIP